MAKDRSRIIAAETRPGSNAVLDVLVPALLRLTPPEATEADVQLTVSPKSSPLLYGVSGHTLINRAWGIDVTEEQANRALAIAVFMLVPDSAMDAPLEYELQILVRESGKQVDYGQRGVAEAMPS